jgi:hypothetical protein
MQIPAHSDSMSFLKIGAAINGNRKRRYGGYAGFGCCIADVGDGG